MDYSKYKHILTIDVETFSPLNIQKTGAHRYVEDCELILTGYAIDEGPIKIVDHLSGEDFPEELKHHLRSKETLKVAHNATFERNVFNRNGFPTITEDWLCTMAMSYRAGLPGALEDVSKALHLGDQGKDSAGTLLINFFCKPCKPTKRNSQRTRNLPEHDLDKWEKFKYSYLYRDVLSTRIIHNKLKEFHPPHWERDVYLFNEKVNQHGVLIDSKFPEAAIAIDKQITDKAKAEFFNITGIAKPKSGPQVKEWLTSKLGYEPKSLDKKVIGEHLGKNADVDRALAVRSLLMKATNAKYKAMVNSRRTDGTGGGYLRYYGAFRTGRWAGNIVQPQNLTQNHLGDFDELNFYRNLVLDGDFELLNFLFKNPSDAVAQLVRTSFVAPPGHTLAVVDFSAVEARGLSWLAGEKWRLDVFNSHGKIYEASASKMFGVPIEEITKGSALRQKGKIAELALGYGGSVGAMMAMGGDKLGLSPQEMKTIVDQWRRSNPAIKKLWNILNFLAVSAVQNLGKPYIFKGLKFKATKDYLELTLPSGRALYYREPRLFTNRFGQVAVKYMGVAAETGKKNKAWVYVDTWGGKLSENVIQAVCRDLLALSMLRLDRAGFKIVMHIHDEAVCVVPESNAEDHLKRMVDIMEEDVLWADGFPIGADGYLTPYYLKD